MTRETKIGLLVGLAFLIVIGILLSDHFRGTMEPPPATLDRVGANAREAVTVPGANQLPQPIAVTPEVVNPTSTVQTPGDLEPRPNPVVMGNTQAVVNGPLPINDPLQQAAQQQGESLVPANGQTNPVPPLMATSQRTYKAESGDSVSRMAAKLLGANTSRNRKAIIAANPSLQENPNMVVVGQDYMIPGSSGLAIQAAAQSPAITTGGQWTYVVKHGDTLWGIATGQLNNAGAIEAIKELNRDLLHGGSTIRAGMKLRLPSAPVAVAD